MRSSVVAQRESFLVRMRSWAVAVVVVAGLVAGGFESAEAQKTCSRVQFEGDVKAGEGFTMEFARGLTFFLEPLKSGWIVRVLATGEPRGPHDYAELATPPYRSVSPLLITTDWSFRAQDAVGWNPRRFRYAGDTKVFRQLADLYPGVMANDPSNSAKVGELVTSQPEGVFQILDARFVPGLADQARMAASVASHFLETPHTVDQSVAPSPLGKLEELRFRVTIDLLPGAGMAKIGTPGMKVEKISCPAPTAGTAIASQQRNK